MLKKVLKWVGDVLFVFIIIYGTVGLLLSCNEKSSFMIKTGVDGGR